MKIKEMLLSGVFFTTFNWSPPKSNPSNSPKLEFNPELRNIDYEGIPKIEPEMPTLVRLNEEGIACTYEGKTATADEIREWNRYMEYFYIQRGWTKERTHIRIQEIASLSIQERSHISVDFVPIKDKDGNEILY